MNYESLRGSTVITSHILTVGHWYKDSETTLGWDRHLSPCGPPSRWYRATLHSGIACQIGKRLDQGCWHTAAGQNRWNCRDEKRGYNGIVTVKMGTGKLIVSSYVSNRWSGLDHFLCRHRGFSQASLISPPLQKVMYFSGGCVVFNLDCILPSQAFYQFQLILQGKGAQL